LTQNCRAQVCGAEWHMHGSGFQHGTGPKPSGLEGYILNRAGCQTSFMVNAGVPLGGAAQPHSVQAGQRQ
jgi:hypothetical protein